MLKSKNTIPPLLADRLLRTFLRDDLAEEVIGDLKEQFEYALEVKSPLRARLNYWYQVFHYLRPFALKRRTSSNSNYPSMYQSYFRTAIRSMRKNKLHAFINIAGLSVGLAVAIIIGLWIKDEISFEKSFDNYATIGHVVQNVTNNGEVETWTNTPFPLAEELRKNYGGDFKHIVVTGSRGYHLLTFETTKVTKQGLFAEPAFTEIFSIKMKSGTRDAIKDQSSVLISASAAKAFIGESDPLGKVMVIDDDKTVHVAGVYDDIPENSRFTGIQFIGSWELLYERSSWMKTMSDPWRPNSFDTYVQLNDQATFKEASEKIKDAKLKKVSAALAKKKPELFLHPMSEWHLKSEFHDGKQSGGRIQYVWMFGIVGSFVLLMACINFMNLSTAQSEKRAREVGIRKAVGSLRGQLISQFFSESILTTFFALLLAMLLVQLTLPWFNLMAAKQMTLPFGNPSLWILSLGLCIFIGIVAGSYPALYLSSIKSVTALKGAFKSGGAALPRKILVTIQFSVSVSLIIGTLVVFLQIQYAQNRPIGYDTNGLVSVPINSPAVHTHFDVIKSELLNNGAIVEMAEAASPTTDTWSSSSQFEWDGKDPDLSVDFLTLSVSHDYGRTIHWQISEGRDFSRDFASDSSGFVINESAARYLELKNPIGTIIKWAAKPYAVVGIVKDMVIRSPYEPIRPMFYFLSGSQDNFIIFRINPASSALDAIAKIESAMKMQSADLPFSYQFTDEQYALKFDNERRVGKLASVFATLAIFISCLGTFGLSSFVAEQRTKEVGVRKVMGASIFQLWQLMSRDFVMLVSLSCIIAVPIAFVILTSWLKGYHYHTSMPWWPFVVTACGTLIITMVTASWHTLKAATANPVKSLRSE